jgi:hypothetical protein
MSDSAPANAEPAKSKGSGCIGIFAIIMVIGFLANSCGSGADSCRACKDEYNYKAKTGQFSSPSDALMQACVC